MLTFSHDLNGISILWSFLYQSVSVDVEPVKGFADGFLILHLEALLTIIGQFVWYVHHTVIIFKNIANI